METFLSYNLILPKYLRSVKEKGSLNPKMRAWEGGASIFTAFLYFLSAPPPASPKKLRAKPKQAGKKKRGCRGMPQHQSKAWYWVKIFARLFCPAKRDWDGKRDMRPSGRKLSLKYGSSKVQQLRH